MAVIRNVWLVVDDSGLAATAGRALRDGGYAVELIPDGAAAELRLVGDLPDLLVVPLLLTGRSGLFLAGRAKERSDGRVRVLLVADDLPAAHRDYAYATGVDAVAPADPAAILAAADRLGPRLLVRIGSHRSSRAAARY